MLKEMLCALVFINSKRALFHFCIVMMRLLSLICFINVRRFTSREYFNLIKWFYNH